jgi:hypothetical protein
VAAFVLELLRPPAGASPTLGSGDSLGRRLPVFMYLRRGFGWFWLESVAAAVESLVVAAA